MFNSLYTGITSIVKWNGEISDAFDEKQGIRQGGTSSADCYKAGKNKLLCQLDDNTTHKIGHIHAGAIMVADDLALISNSAHSMQTALKLAETDASRERYNFNINKTKVICLNERKTPQLVLNGEVLEVSKKEVHLGIHRNNKNNNMDTVLDRVKSARLAAYSLMQGAQK